MNHDSNNSHHNKFIKIIGEASAYSTVDILQCEDPMIFMEITVDLRWSRSTPTLNTKNKIKNELTIQTQPQVETSKHGMT